MKNDHSFSLCLESKRRFFLFSISFTASDTTQKTSHSHIDRLAELFGGSTVACSRDLLSCNKSVSLKYNKWNASFFRTMCTKKNDWSGAGVNRDFEINLHLYWNLAVLFKKFLS